ncbi:lytic transglycosylase domain-containing protein [Parasphingorhabdus sp. JC815]|uniref:lytic transglycosylase domain-containing protein n=1 Tax=Parasphingorhabdus sp. JC815 TaxID=3232140 RepID=UPI003458D084
MHKLYWALLPVAVLPGAATSEEVIQESITDTAKTLISSTGDFELFQHGIWPRVNSSAEAIDVYANPVSLAERRVKTRSLFREKLYEAEIREAELRHGIPLRLLQALIWQESRFNPMAISPAGAAGLAQLMPGTARYLGVMNRHDPKSSIDGGARYLKEMLGKFGAIDLALAAYNAGPGAVERARGIPQNHETPDYVTKVLARWKAIVR